MGIPQLVNSCTRFILVLLVASRYNATAARGGESVPAPFTNDPVELPAMHHAPTHYEAESYNYWYENKPMPHRHGDLHNPMERHQHFPRYQNENEEKLFSNFVTDAPGTGLNRGKKGRGKTEETFQGGGPGAYSESESGNPNESPYETGNGKAPGGNEYGAAPPSGPGGNEYSAPPPSGPGDNEYGAPYSPERPSPLPPSHQPKAPKQPPLHYPHYDIDQGYPGPSPPEKELGYPGPPPSEEQSHTPPTPEGGSESGEDYSPSRTTVLPRLTPSRPPNPIAPSIPTPKRPSQGVYPLPPPPTGGYATLLPIPPHAHRGGYATPPPVPHRPPSGGYAITLPMPPRPPSGGYVRQPPRRPTTGGYVVPPPSAPSGGYALPPVPPQAPYGEYSAPPPVALQPPRRPTGGYVVPPLRAPSGGNGAPYPIPIPPRALPSGYAIPPGIPPPSPREGYAISPFPPRTPPVGYAAPPQSYYKKFVGYPQPNINHHPIHHFVPSSPPTGYEQPCPPPTGYAKPSSSVHPNVVTNYPQSAGSYSLSRLDSKSTATIHPQPRSNCSPLGANIAPLQSAIGPGAIQGAGGCSPCNRNEASPHGPCSSPCESYQQLNPRGSPCASLCPCVSSCCAQLPTCCLPRLG